ncbi:hypothetical protein F5I97DRAFT_1137525 [Phlebopus sp. FC_14]|nr:hypothetical protein F5I97DRAFT_1137525 [Phlebopus sp. FC_14]
MSDLASYLLYLEQLEYCQVAVVSALFYDYLLTFGREVDLVWRKPWSLVSSLYVVVRYLSIPLQIDTIFYMGNIHLSAQVSLALYEIRQWGQFVYRIAMDAIMILRVDAMSVDASPSSRGSKPVFLLMVISCVAKNVTIFVLLMLSVGPGSHLVSLEGNFAGTYICGTMPNTTLFMPTDIPLVCFEILLFVLATAYFVKHVRERYRVWKRWKVNEFMKILARDSTIYFAL